MNVILPLENSLAFPIGEVNCVLKPFLIGP